MNFPGRMMARPLADSVKRHGSDAASRRAEEELRDFVENAPVAMHRLGPDGLILWANRNELEMLGYAPDEYIGHHIAEFHADGKAMEEILRRLARGELVQEYEARLRRKDGSIRDVVINSSVLWEDGNFIHTRGFTRDISDRKKAERANRLKDDFLAILSHELRTPLNAIVGWAHILRDHRADTEMGKKAVETIHRNAQAQNQLISDVLDVSRIVAGKLRLERRPVELRRVIEAAVDTVRPAAGARAIQIDARFDPDAGPISGDPDRLQQVVWNLLANAIRFVPKEGRITVRLEGIESDVRITVEDDGPGIDPELLPHVFDRFRQSDGSENAPHRGLGLGLTIVRHLVEMHGGTVRANNHERHRGAVFTIELPRLGVADEVDPQPNSHPPPEAVWLDAAPSLDGLRILVVEDEMDTRDVLKEMLERRGATVTACASAGEGLSILRREHPNVLVADLEMPGESGYELIRELRALPPEDGGLTPAAALTAHAGAHDRMRALSAGFEIHVPKPVQPAELAAVVATLARAASARKTPS
jgi:PAS domain S-box-containing protein